MGREVHRQATVYIDKLDGHLWSHEDIEHLRDEAAIMRRKAKYAKAYTAGLPMTRWPERYATYDVVISRVCRTQPQIQDLILAIPGLANELLQARFVVNGMMTKEQYAQWGDFPFLELDLSYNLAQKLAFRLQEAGAWANVIPTVYREPQFPFSTAQMLAEQVIKERHESVAPNELLGPVGLYRWLWTPYWIFSASSPAAPPEPGYLFAYIDNIDGHVWTYDEERLFIREGTLT
ncbi:hypothetical protein [Dictyobacter kobayashii]|uniref:Uncharacterized protein n=1 Tax=Dictyobacter kobayashii TaxID=2014872 RepID=A0A402AVV2_9CHLR|nr:hypothetical protein [Dictyobacter kobayashii]GCE23153.1 hypothetical protein KDK_69530 [Dictyobacter kobayashii]